MNIEKIIERNHIIAILRNVSTDILPKYVETILDGGVCTIEIAMNTPGADKQIRLIKNTFGKDVVIGAGTAITEERIAAAADAGASFFLTPSVTEKNLLSLLKTGLPILPGVLTPSDVERCISHGLHTMKLFPASELPFTYIKSLQGPFADTDYVAVGGVTIENIDLFFQAGYVGAGIAGALIPEHFIQDGLWQQASRHVEKFVQAAKRYFP